MFLAALPQQGRTKLRLVSARASTALDFTQCALSFGHMDLARSFIGFLLLASLGSYSIGVFHRYYR
jgi:hypothetical protein